jgi:hypothetical protein
MAYDPQRHHRRSIRLKGYDYTQPGAYFITICTHGRECLFGEIIDGEMHLNEAGQIVVQSWQDLPNHVPNVQLDAFVVMPNHVHGIIIITDHAGGIGAGLKPARTTMGPGFAADPGSAGGVGSTAGPGSVGAGSEPAPTTTTASGSTAGSGPVGAQVWNLPLQDRPLPDRRRAYRKSSANSKPSPHAESMNYGVPQAPPSGNATITNTSSATNPRSTASANISPRTRPAGTPTRKIPKGPIMPGDIHCHPPHPSRKTLHPTIPRTLPAHKPPHPYSPLAPPALKNLPHRLQPSSAPLALINPLPPLPF